MSNVILGTASEVDPLGIHKDGTTTTTATIPFAKSVSLSRTDSYPLTLTAEGDSPMLTPHSFTSGSWTFDDELGEVDARAKLIIANGSVDAPTPYDTVGIVMQAAGSGSGAGYISGSVSIGSSNSVLTPGGLVGIYAGWGSIGGNIELRTNTGFTGRAGDIVLFPYQQGSTSGVVIIGSGSDSLPAGIRGTYALFVQGGIYADNLTGGSMLKASATKAISSATAGTDYAPATSGSAILKGNGAGGFSSAVAGTDYQAAIAAGSTSQYWRGDKTWQTLTQNAVAGLTTSSAPVFSGVGIASASTGLDYGGGLRIFDPVSAYVEIDGTSELEVYSGYTYIRGGLTVFGTLELQDTLSLLGEHNGFISVSDSLGPNLAFAVDTDPLGAGTESGDLQIRTANIIPANGTDGVYVIGNPSYKFNAGYINWLYLDSSLTGVLTATAGAVGAVPHAPMFIHLEAPASGDVIAIQQVNRSVTLLGVTATVGGSGTVAVDLEKRNANALNSAGTAMLSSSLTATASGATTTSFSSATMTSGQFLVVKIPSAPSGTVNFVTVEVQYK